MRQATRKIAGYQMATALQAARRARGWSQARAVWELMRLAEAKGLKVASATSLKTQLSRWENGHVTPGYYQDLLCRFYRMTPDELGISSQQSPSPPAAEDDHCTELIASREWLRTLDQVDQQADWEPGTARKQVASRLARLDVGDLQDRASRRRRVSQRHIAEVLGDYYRGSHSGETASHGLYRARIGHDKEILTSVLTYPGWLDLDCPLTATSDQLQLTSAPRESVVSLDADVTDAATQRLAEAFATDHRLVDVPLYRLLAVDVTKGLIAGSVAVTPFVRYALTMDLLEGELIDALAAGSPTRSGSLPLRDRYLPDIRAVLDLAGRLCAGGTLALCAIARPASPDRGPADFALLVQERSDHVVNAARRLAVIPKGFHQPMTDFRADARIGATLLREMEEELFGRADTDSTTSGRHTADSMHQTRLSEPMRWLTDKPGHLRLECTGFGFNLVSGNFEFASLIIIESEDFWQRYGGQVEANWEAESLRMCSSLDSESITELAGDAAWSNEGLFAFLQGLRRLRQIGGSRADIPAIDWEI
jgi:transcriptional regulator with XRE-family HTH domain